MTSSDRTDKQDAARERFRRADTLFDAALDLEPDLRTRFIEKHSGNDKTLAADVLALLKAHDLSAEFLLGPAASDTLMRELQTAVGGVYTIQRRIAIGGMASVYLADDVRHQRPVAIKVFAADAAGAHAGDTERFLAEIRMMARLQHPGLLPLFDSGANDSLLYYVMPFVDGETLRERLKRESIIPVDEALRLTCAIAAALAVAHGAGVIHRDLKPANILLREGQPLVADFGIALALSDSAEQRQTKSGMLIGTAQYMSPEQASGEHAIDLRTDVYSLGVMLYEMLTGDPPHVARTTQGVLAKVRAERPTSAHLLRDSIPLHVSAAIDRALAKRPADRFQTMPEFAAALVASPPPAIELPKLPVVARVPRTKVIVAATIVLVAAASFVIRGSFAAAPATSRFAVAPLADAAIGRPPSITPDGGSLVYAGSAATGRRLFVRRISELDARAMPGTEGALNAFVSPNGRWIGFITSDDKLQKVPLDGGAPTVLTGVFRYSDAAWAGNDRIVIASYGQQGLSWVSAAGGGLHPLTRLDTKRRDSGHGQPFVLPDFRTVVFLIARDRTGPGPEPGELAVVSLDSTAGVGTVTRLELESRGAVGFVDGWLLYIAPDGRNIMAVRFDAATRAIRGEPLRVLEQNDGGIEVAAMASNGTLLYTRMQTLNAPMLVDSTGVAHALLKDVEGSFMNPRLSPDGRFLAVQSTGKKGNDVSVYELTTGALKRVTSSGSAVGPTWFPDGRAIAFFSTQGAADAAWRTAASGNEAAERILHVDGLFGLNVIDDGHALLFQRMINGVWSIWHADTDADSNTEHSVREIVAGQYDAFMPSLSPNGRWLAYATNESGRYEVYVRPFAGGGSAVQISLEGGAEPAWSRDGTRLYYRGDRRMFAANIVQTPVLKVVNRRVLFTDTFDGDMPMPHRNYDVTRDGKFVMIATSSSATPQTIVALNWLNELRAALQVAKP